MTQSQGGMREIYPDPGEVYGYRMENRIEDGVEDRESHFIFNLEGDVEAGLKPSIALRIESRETGEGLCRTESGHIHPFAWAWVGPELHLWLDGDLFVFQRADPLTSSRRRRGAADATQASGDVLAPMPGVVLEVLVGEGDRVERNQAVALVESMKMELVITAPRSGVVRRVSAHPGQQVDRGMRLLELAPEGDAGG